MNNLPLIRPKKLPVGAIVYVSDMFSDQDYDDLVPLRVLDNDVRTSWPEWAIYKMETLDRPRTIYSGAYAVPDVLSSQIHASLVEILKFKASRWWRRQRHELAKWIYPEGDF